MTSFRAEDIALLATLGEGELEPVTKRSSDIPKQLSDLSETLDDYRTMRSLLLGATDPSEIPPEDLASLITRFLTNIESTYTVHTGGSRTWTAQDPLGDQERLADSIRRSGVGPPLDLTTHHIFEAGALLNEIGDFLWHSWHWGSPDAEFEPLPRDFEAYVADRVEGASPIYTACLTAAMQIWQGLFPELHSLSAPNFLARAYVALASCLDIAINPSIGPISPLEATAWAEISPPHRYLLALDAVSTVGIPKRWPGEREYAEYRATLCEVSSLPIGRLDHRSFQHPRFSGEFFSTVEADDPLLPSTTHFDYLVWAMEGMHAFRSSHGLTWAIPRLLFRRHEGGPDLLLPVLSPDYAWSAAPLYWSGRELGIEPRLSEPFGVNLVIQLMVTHMLRQVVTRRGSFDLTELFPEELLGDESIVNLALGGVVRATGLEDLLAWEFIETLVAPELPDTDAEVFESARIRPSERMRIEIPRADVEALNLEVLAATFARLREDPLKHRFCLDLWFNGYDAQAQGLWDIAEVRAYALRLRETFPFWPWYLAISSNPAEFVGPILLLVAGVEEPRRITMDEYRDFLITMFRGLNMEADRIDLPEAELEEMSMDVRDAVIGLMQARLG